ncbi:MAG TPA: single-stranded DNA-binding protein [Dissulfurispiraceae bacterium]|nr:single-stranded DNA-binding protein [Dissulfurispiraceae bacterium]
MFNRIILIGNLTRDPEVRYTPGGTPVATISIAVNSKYKQGDDTKEEVLFINAVVFGKQAESCGHYLNKGNPVLVEGRLRERKWESEGVQKSKFEVIANNVRFLPKREQRPAPAEGSNIADLAPPDETTDLEPF